MKILFIFSWLSEIKTDLKLKYGNRTKDTFVALKFFVSPHPHFSYILRKSVMLKKYKKKRKKDLVRMLYFTMDFYEFIERRTN